MEVVIANIGYGPHAVFPWADMLVGDVCYGLVDQDFCFVLGCAQETSHTEVDFFRRNVVAFAVVEQGIVVVGYIVVNGANTVGANFVLFVAAFVGQQVVVGIVLFPFGCRKHNYRRAKGSVARLPCCLPGRRASLCSGGRRCHRGCLTRTRCRFGRHVPL